MMVSNLGRKVDNPSSNSGWVPYVLLSTNTLERIRIHLFSFQLFDFIPCRRIILTLKTSLKKDGLCQAILLKTYHCSYGCSTCGFPMILKDHRTHNVMWYDSVKVVFNHNCFLQKLICYNSNQNAIHQYDTEKKNLQ